MQMSFEQIDLLGAANVRRRARLVLELSQAIVSGSGTNDQQWKKLQATLFERCSQGMFTYTPE